MTHEEFADRIVAMQDALYRVATTILPQLCDREDAVQSAIEKAWIKQGKLRDDGAMQAWVIRILINECYAILRLRKRERPCEAPPERAATRGAHPRLYALFTSLDDKYRLPMALYYVEGYTVEEVSRMLKLPQGTVKSRLHRGRKLLRETLDGEETDQ